jgi:hypothetical protein
MQHYLLLSRNLLYTGLTRAKQLVVLIGPTRAIGLAIKRVMDRQRYTALADRLKPLGTTSARLQNAPFSKCERRPSTNSDHIEETEGGH